LNFHCERSEEPALAVAVAFLVVILSKAKNLLLHLLLRPKARHIPA